VHNKPPLRLQLLQVPHERELLVRGVHELRSFESCG
jgi:hypothetical protein